MFSHTYYIIRLNWREAEAVTAHALTMRYASDEQLTACDTDKQIEQLAEQLARFVNNSNAYPEYVASSADEALEYVAEAIWWAEEAPNGYYRWRELRKFYKTVERLVKDTE